MLPGKRILSHGNQLTGLWVYAAGKWAALRMSTKIDAHDVCIPVTMTGKEGLYAYFFCFRTEFFQGADHAGCLW